MNVGGQQKKSNLFSPRQSPAATTAPTRSRCCCRAINDCMSMGTIFSTSQNENQHSLNQSNLAKLEQQVVDLEREVLKQKELRIMYRKRMERAQDYLKYCLQIAQDNGFLDVIIQSKNKDHKHERPLSLTMVNTDLSPPIPTSAAAQQIDLTTLIDEAKKNGWYIDCREIELLEEIGQGTTAQIYRAMWRGHEVGVKCITPDFFRYNESGVAFFAQEVQTLSKQRHRFVLQLMGACLHPPNYAWVVTELLGLTLKEWLHGCGGRRKERLVPLPPIEERISKALEIAQAMQYLHEQKPKVIHRDLKPSNIFLDDANHVRIADFGHARFLKDNDRALTGETGTYVYMAPEVIRWEPYNEKCDVYSFAIILNELVTGNHPYIETDNGPSKIAMEVAEGKLRPALPEDNNGQLGELINLISISWNQDASIRPSFGVITNHLREIQQMIIESNENDHITSKLYSTLDSVNLV